MKADTPHTSPHGPEPPRSPGWFATFTILDLSSVISSSQLQRLLAFVKKLWHRTAAAV